MSSALTRLVRTPEGTATRFGWSFISLFRRCPREFFYHYLRPHTDRATSLVDGSGCVPFGGYGALGVGSGFHAAQDAWYQSDPTGGQYDLDAALAAARDLYYSDTAQYGDDEDREKMLSEVKVVMTRHHEWFGPEGHTPEWPEWRPCLDANGEIMVEREFDISLGYGEFRFTTRIDLVMLDLDGYIVPWEHKTCDASRQGAALREYSLSGQLTGQKWAVLEAWPEARPRLRDPHINLIIKRAAKGKCPRQLVPMPRYAEDMERFRVGVIRTLKYMEELIEEYEHLVATGMPAEEAGMVVFPGEPSGIICAGAFSKPCSYAPACGAKRYATNWFRDQTRPLVTLDATAHRPEEM